MKWDSGCTYGNTHLRIVVRFKIIMLHDKTISVTHASNGRQKEC